MVTDYYPLFNTKSIWRVDEKDTDMLRNCIKSESRYSKNHCIVAFQQRCSWAIVKLTAKLYKIELHLYAAIDKWRSPCLEPLGCLLHRISKEQVSDITILITSRKPWLSISSSKMVIALRWLETVLIVLRFNPIRVRFPDEKFCPALYTLDHLRASTLSELKHPNGLQINKLFANLRNGCHELFDKNDIKSVDPLEYLMSVDQEKYKEMIKWVSIADGMRSSFMELLRSHKIQESMMDKLYAWIYKICLFMNLQQIWTTGYMLKNLDLLWELKISRINQNNKSIDI
eukprot:NODE_279_length_11907_cov_0.265244.p4 type:complete len:286 gc:universal NODE_279_length_11907_cov_0.265244:826-1683(+)